MKAPCCSRSPSTIPPIRSTIRRKPVRVQLTLTSSSTIREPGTSTAAATQKAALERSPGTAIDSSPSSSTRRTVTRPPSRSIGAPAAASIRSVWSRLGFGSTTVVGSAVLMPAISTHDLTCAVATGSTYSIPRSSAPWTVNGGKRSSVASIVAPISRSGIATRSTGRLRIELSPSKVQLVPGRAASQPGSSRISVPALPTSIGPSGGCGSCRPVPRISSSPGPVRCTSAPTAWTAASVELVSAASR